MFTFCYDKRQSWDEIGQPDTCFVMAKYDDYYILAHLDAFDYYPLFFDTAPIEEVEPEDEKEDARLCKSLNPKTIEIRTNYATIELRGKIYEIHKYGAEW